MFSKTFLLAGLASVASAHMMISNPVPYGKSNLNNSPLDASGSDFPCKQRDGVYDAQGASNVYAQGSTQKLSFVGTAVHGGGSCQISVTTDLAPDANSVWKVIKSIEGGCPAQGEAGNIGDDANAVDPYTYDFTVPKELVSGNYTLAWTWFNKVGNREMYMNCAPLTVTGSGGSADHLSSLPDMFTANIGNGCGTVSDTDVEFPNAGSEVEKLNGSTDAFAAPTGTGCAAGSGGGSSATATNAPAATTTAATPATTAAPANGGGSGSSATAPGGAPVATSTPVSGGGSGDGSSSGETFTAGTACTTEGEWNCIGGTSFQRCASGAWTAAQALSDGVSCTPGQSADIALSAKRGISQMRRSLRIRG
ncbi:hypothetical protein BGZ61DRAFT_383918 [Ilyonectria robusta]|uniref:uncharacterized protein n=1 Tax=Ilyonectria robusta TaxID=1079257 RepID=UPI001E8E0246|nr:uncharacterized protein BGZ61DRAFT_383918 [Ilyonectria robusta]KAH8733629.1 hypothetical protein BGZ61DRAFT_383918 [Ilyonectria robusta]